MGETLRNGKHVNGFTHQPDEENRFLQLHNVSRIKQFSRDDNQIVRWIQPSEKELFQVLLRLGQKIEALVREDCLFAEEQLDLSEDILRVLAGTPFVDAAFETKDEVIIIL